MEPLDDPARSSSRSPRSRSSPGTLRGQAAPGRRHVLTRQVFAAESSFAATMANRDSTAFATFVAPEAIFFGEKSVMRGKAAVVDGWRPLFAGPAAPVLLEAGDGRGPRLRDARPQQRAGPRRRRAAGRAPSIRSGGASPTAPGWSSSTRAARSATVRAAPDRATGPAAGYLSAVSLSLHRQPPDERRRRARRHPRLPAHRGAAEEHAAERLDHRGRAGERGGPHLAPLAHGRGAVRPVPRHRSRPAAQDLPDPRSRRSAARRRPGAAAVPRGGQGGPRARGPPVGAGSAARAAARRSSPGCGTSTRRPARRRRSSPRGSTSSRPSSSTPRDSTRPTSTTDSISPTARRTPPRTRFSPRCGRGWTGDRGAGPGCRRRSGASQIAYLRECDVRRGSRGGAGRDWGRS